MFLFSFYSLQTPPAIVEFTPPPLIFAVAPPIYRQPLPPFPPVKITMQIAFNIKVQLKFGFDASGVHDLMGQGFKDPANWGVFFFPSSTECIRNPACMPLLLSFQELVY